MTSLQSSNEDGPVINGYHLTEILNYFRLFSKEIISRIFDGFWPHLTIRAWALPLYSF